jgi:hypothetical protein
MSFSVVVVFVRKSITEAQSSQRSHRELEIIPTDSEGVAAALNSERDATLSELRHEEMRCVFPGLQRTQPWAGISQRFQRNAGISLAATNFPAEISLDLMDLRVV